LPTTIRFLEPERVIESLYSGVVVGSDFDGAVDEAIRLARHHGRFVFLSDLTDLARGPSPGDLFAMVQMLEARDLPRTLREALVVPHASPEKADVQFYEDACRNRGWDIRLFPDRASALTWLTGPDTAPGPT
jgi:hypothetical protein